MCAPGDVAGGGDAAGVVPPEGYIGSRDCLGFAGGHGDGDGEGDRSSRFAQCWSRAAWREIRNCPGRFVPRSRSLAALTPGELLDLEGGEDTVKRWTVEGKDPMELVFFQDGSGGLLTYLKSGAETVRRVHTLNTFSGLTRKLLAMDVPQEILPCDPPQLATVFRVALHTLSFVAPEERNGVASFVCPLLRDALFSR